MADQFPAPEIITIKQDFFQSSLQALRRLWTQPLVKIRMPKIQLLMGGDEYYYKLFSLINSAKSNIFCVTYTFDDSELANKVLQAIVRALDRGVTVYMVIDDLISNMNPKHKQLIIDHGGIILTRNTVKNIMNMFDKSFFQRDHEKILFVDNKFLIGSANIGVDYGGKKYGNNFFLDLNVYGKNCLIPEFVDMLEDLIFSMQGKMRFDQFQIFNDLHKYKTAYPIFSEFYNNWLKLTYCKQPFHMQIQRNLLWHIDHAQKNIKIIAPYYYPIESLNRALTRAKARGVKVEIVTSVDRDIPAYREFSNSLLFNKLLLQGIEVYEYGHHYLHAKGVLIDDEYLSVGSFNIDRWSWWNNIEAMVEIINHKNELNQFKNIYYELKSKSYPVPLKEGVEKEKGIMIRGWKLFHFLCDKLMNRGVYSFLQNSEGSLLERMQTNMSWNYEKYRRIKKLDSISVEDYFDSAKIRDANNQK